MLTEDCKEFVPTDLLELYEVYNYKNAAQIMSTTYSELYAELCDALSKFRVTTQQIRKGGGNESDIPKTFSRLLRPNAWYETKISGDLVITMEVRKPLSDGARRTKKVISKIERARFLDGHKVDYVKGEIAFDLEWNSKDQTFDRDLYAFRAFFDCGIIGVGVLVTRGASLTPYLEGMGPEIKRKYGASTTWMGKLLNRLETGRSGGCPVLAFGITPNLVIENDGA